ncbi:carboxypeptidase-like regulatory domain-containing protein [Psychroserpens sp. MEBiC05023]
MRYFLICFLFTQFLFGQRINGIVLDSETKVPIENVTISFKKDNSGTVTNASGKFYLKLKSKISKTDSLNISCIGYHSKSVSIRDLKNELSTIFLSKKLENLDQVVVNSAESLNDKLKFKRLAPLRSRVSDFGSLVVGNYIYVVSGNSSYLQDMGKKALMEVSLIPNATLADLLRELRRGFYYEGYSNKLQIYDIINNSWSVSKISFRERAYHNLNCYGNTLYSIGGKRLSTNRKKEYLENTIEVFDMASDKVIIDHTNPHQAINFASFIYNDNVILMGGSTSINKNGKKIYTDASHIYNITSGSWYDLPKMTTQKETQGVIIDNTIYLIGGHDGQPLKTIESYNIKTKAWSHIGDLFQAMEQPALATNDHIIYIYDANRMFRFDTISGLIEMYDLNVDLESPKLHYYQNKLYILGGFTENAHTKAASSEVYVIDLEDFENTKIINSKFLVRERS